MCNSMQPCERLTCAGLGVTRATASARCATLEEAGAAAVARAPVPANYTPHQSDPFENDNAQHTMPLTRA